MQLPFVVIGCFLIGRRTEVPRKIVKCNWRKIPFPGRVGPWSLFVPETLPDPDAEGYFTCWRLLPRKVSSSFLAVGIWARKPRLLSILTGDKEKKTTCTLFNFDLQLDEKSQRHTLPS